MSRLKSMAPPPPPGGSRQKVGHTPRKDKETAETPSLILMFDDLIRNEKVLSSGAAEERFLQFASNQDLCRKRWEAAEVELQRLQIELQSSDQEVKKLEMKLAQARELLQSESDLKKKAEQEREVLSQKWELVRELISSDQAGQTFNDDTRQRLAKLEASVVTVGRRGMSNIFSPGPPGGLNLSPVNEMDSTASILDASDLSFDKTEGTLGGDESRLRSGRPYQRRSSGGVAALNRSRQTRSRSHGARKSLEAIAAKRQGAVVSELQQRIVKRTRYEERNIDEYLPSAPALPSDSDDAVMAWQNARNLGSPQLSSASVVTVVPRQGSTVTLTPSNPSTATLQPSTPYTPANPVSRANSLRSGVNRKHQWVQKSNFKTEVCGPCGKRIRFGKPCFKCRECRSIAHPECRDAAPLPCVPTGSAQKTPSRGGGRAGCLADYTPHTAPMVPAIVVHCCNELELRGMQEVGLYRVPGSEREVRELREKFLAGRGCPALHNYDVHTLAGVVKDFLRGLREPLIPLSMWAVFTQAATNPDLTDGMSEIYQAISELSQPNRDTMAFIMLHLQKVTENKETKMTVSNLAKILGPTIVGYSSPDPQPEEIMQEVGVQAATMERLITIDSEYWRTFLAGAGEDLYRDPRILSPLSPDNIFRTPQLGEEQPGQLRALRNGKKFEIGPRPVHQATTGKIFSSPVLL